MMARERIISFRVTEAEYAHLQAQADAAGVTLSALARGRTRLAPTVTISPGSMTSAEATVTWKLSAA